MMWLGMQPFWLLCQPPLRLLPKHLTWHLPQRPQAVPCQLQHLRQHLDQVQSWLLFHPLQTAPCQRQCLHRRWHPRLRTAPCLRQCLLQRLQMTTCQRRCMRHHPQTAQQVRSVIDLSHQPSSMPQYLSDAAAVTTSILSRLAMVSRTCTYCRDSNRAKSVTSAAPGHAQMH